jgi:hypothetical protein
MLRLTVLKVAVIDVKALGFYEDSRKVIKTLHRSLYR